jgi:hypothetical protein
MPVRVESGAPPYLPMRALLAFKKILSYAANAAPITERARWAPRRLD